MATAARTGGAVVRAMRTAAADATDRELLERFTLGDEAAFAALVARHGGLVQGVCRRVLPTVQDAEDATQAVFLVLAKKAAVGRWQQSIANWLYTTARRIAAKANRSARRRTAREARPAPPASPSALDQMTGREAFAALDAELDRLPAGYREPLVLCHLQGLTRDEAAARLGVPTGTLKTRLERGRKRLADALTRRGVVLGAGLLAVAATSPAGASPPALTASVLAAVHGSPSAAAVALAQGVDMTGFLTRAKLLAVAGLVAVGFGLAGVAADPPKMDKPKADAKAEPKTAATERTITGTVVGADGKPVAGARVWLCESGGLIAATRPAPEHAATTDDGGRYAIIRKGDGGRAWAMVAATKDGFGPGFDFAKATPGDDTALRCSLALVADDVPIAGRVLDLQGKPVAGASVWPVTLYRTDGATLVAWEKAARRSTKEAAVGFNTFFPRSLRLVDGPLAGVGVVKTDKDGRFTFAGLGRDRLVTLRVSAPGVATTDFDAVTRAMTAVTTPADRLESQYIPRTYHGATFDLTVEPSQPFVGVVTDKETGQPVPGVVVRARSGWQGGVQAVSDASGKYKLDGLRTGEQELIAIPPIDQPYHLREFTAGRRANELPVTADLELYRGVWVSGTVTDKATGKPVTASLSYRPDGFNGEEDRIPGYSPRGLHDPSWYVTDTAGQFRVLAVPGKGFVFVRAYREYLSADQVDWQGELKDTAPRPYVASSPVEIASNWSAIAGVTADAGKVYALTVDAGATVKAKITDADGQPLSGATVTQRTNFSVFEVSRVDAADVTFERVNPKRPRLVLVLHPEKHLGAMVRADATAIKLTATGTATGRLLGEGGKPLANIPIEIRYTLDKDIGWRTTELYPEVTTDAAGRFVVPNLIPGVRYELRWPRVAPKKANAYHQFEVPGGGEKHLGDVSEKTDGE